MLVWVKLIFAGKSVILVCSGMQLFSPVTSSVAIRVIFNHWLTWITRTNKVSGCCKYGWWCVWKAQIFFGQTGPVYACLYWIVTFFPGHFFFKSFADDRTVSLHFHGLQVTVIYCSFAARSRRVVGVTVVKVWEISRRYLRRVKAGTYLPSLFSMWFKQICEIADSYLTEFWWFLLQGVACRLACQ